MGKKKGKVPEITCPSINKFRIVRLGNTLCFRDVTMERWLTFVNEILMIHCGTLWILNCGCPRITDASKFLGGFGLQWLEWLGMISMQVAQQPELKNDLDTVFVGNLSCLLQQHVFRYFFLLFWFRYCSGKCPTFQTSAHGRVEITGFEHQYSDYTVACWSP